MNRVHLSMQKNIEHLQKRTESLQNAAKAVQAEKLEWHAMNQKNFEHLMGSQSTRALPRKRNKQNIDKSVRYESSLTTPKAQANNNEAQQNITEDYVSNVNA